MPDKPLLSIAIVVQNQRDIIESTLSSLYELSNIPFELFLIDDASTDGSDEAVQSLLDYYGHARTFYFRHERAAGRANSLNEAIMQCSGSLFWAPESIGGVNESVLGESLSWLENSQKKALIQQQSLPSQPQQWIDLLLKNSWPQDGHFIWNLNAISSENQFFNPYTTHFHGLELAIRLGDGYAVGDELWHQPNRYAEPTTPGFLHRQELLLTMLRKTDPAGEARELIIQKLQNPDELTAKSSREFDNALLEEAAEMKQKGRFNSAFEIAEKVLNEEPENYEAKQLKIEILEKKRRFVEASELKHEAAKPKKQQEPEPEPSPKDIQTSIIIPTTAYGKPALEHCLVSISGHCDTSKLELIIIDNASLDDTHDYINELKEKQFLNCKAITNKQNRGFAASVNQGLEAAAGKYAFIMHNDVEFKGDAVGRLANIMGSHPDFAIIGPATEKTLNPAQAVRNIEESDPDLMPAEYLDSFCMMLRTDTGLKMDEEYELSFFEDIDLCFQAGSAGYKVGIAPKVEVEHHFGTTTFAIGLDTESEQYWKNVAYFNEKWEIKVLSEQELKSLNTFDQLLALDDLVNPLFPEEEIKEQFEQLFTDELKTEILKTEHDAETLCKLVHLFMVMDKREVMRRLEDRLENIELPASLIYQLVRFYFSRNIYSRCTHYLDQLKPQNDTVRADLYRLAIFIENKDLDQAIPLLKDLLEHTSSNPVLYKLAGDIHKFSGNDEEAHSFYNLAEQIDPFNFVNEEKETFGFEL